MLKTVAAAACFAAAALSSLSACSPEEPSPPSRAPRRRSGPARRHRRRRPARKQGGHGGQAQPAQRREADRRSEVARRHHRRHGGHRVRRAATPPSPSRRPRAGQLAPGFHGLHIHSVGKCEANSVAPTGGAPGDFNSAGATFPGGRPQRPPASGDLASLQVREDGSAMLVTTTDAFTAEDLLGGAEDGDHHPREGRTTSPTSRRSATSRSTAPRRRTRPPWPPATPASGWRAVSSPAG